VIFPFVVGSGRSGTTLLRTMLDSHPDLAIPGESHFIPRLAQELRPFSAAAFLDAVFAEERVQKWGMSEQDVRAAFDDRPPAKYPDAVRLFYSCYAASQGGKSRYGDKTPPYVRHLPLLAGLFPEARFVHVIRDGRDVVCSLKQADWFPGNLPQAADYWRGAVLAGRDAAPALGSRYRELRYEALVEDPEAVLRRLGEFLELPYSDAMLDYRQSAQRAIDMALSPRVHGSLMLPPTKGLRDWRRELDPVESGIVWLIAGDVLAELGYAPDKRAIPKAAWARVAQHKAETAFRRNRRRARRLARLLRRA
jgi:hypothetical protein